MSIAILRVVYPSSQPSPSLARRRPRSAKSFALRVTACMERTEMAICGPSGTAHELAERLDRILRRRAFEVDIERLDECEVLVQVTGLLREREDERCREVNLIHAWMSGPDNFGEPGARADWDEAWRCEVGRRACVETVRHCSCGGTRTLIAESWTGIDHASQRGLFLNRGISVALYQCPACGSESNLGWEPPTWISAVARTAARIEQEMEGSRAAGGPKRLMLCPPEGIQFVAEPRVRPERLVAHPHYPPEPFEDQPTHLWALPLPLLLAAPSLRRRGASWLRDHRPAATWIRVIATTRQRLVRSKTRLGSSIQTRLVRRKCP